MIQDLITQVSRQVAVEGQTIFDAVHHSVLTLSEDDLQLMLNCKEQMHSPLAQKILRVARSMVFEREHHFIDRLREKDNLEELYLEILQKSREEHPLTPRGIYFTACFSAVQKLMHRDTAGRPN